MKESDVQYLRDSLGKLVDDFCHERSLAGPVAREAVWGQVSLQAMRMAATMVRSRLVTTGIKRITSSVRKAKV
jgi:hypothetical protein